jgi:hypothetical protein
VFFFVLDNDKQTSKLERGFHTICNAIIHCLYIQCLPKYVLSYREYKLVSLHKIIKTNSSFATS